MERQTLYNRRQDSHFAGSRWPQGHGEVCRANNISEVSFHRWKRQFGMREVNGRDGSRNLERENAELKKMLAQPLLKIRVLEWLRKTIAVEIRVGEVAVRSLSDL